MSDNRGWSAREEWSELVGRAQSLAGADRRGILGIVGPPGAGKSTLAEALRGAIAEHSMSVSILPMDGFHLGDDSLRRHGKLERKGAIDTFDGWGYLATLRRVRTELDHPVFVPGFQRDLEQPIAAALEISPGTRLVITEGNYLLDEAAPWDAVRQELDEVWYVNLPDSTRLDRLVIRHVRFGKEREAAEAWVREVDQVNAVRIEERRSRADLVIDGD